MSELPTAEAGAELPAEANPGTVESGAELATASVEGHEQKPDDGFNQETAKQAINKKHFQYKEEERNRLTAEKERDELATRLQKLEQGDDPVIPPPVDPYADDYEEKTRQRDEAITRKAQFDSQQQFAADQITRTQNEQVQAAQSRSNELVKGFSDRCVKLGLDLDTVDSATNRVVNYGISKDLADFVLDHDEGPLIAQYLAQNLTELDALAGMTPMQAAARIDSVIKTKAASLKPKISQAPDPTDVLSGNGAPETKSHWLSAGTYS
jgi:hypothetical protein